MHRKNVRRIIVQIGGVFVLASKKNIMAAEKRESTEAGKHRDMGIKTVQGQDNEGHILGSKQAEFNERQNQAEQQREDDAPLNREDARGTVSGTEQV